MRKHLRNLAANWISHGAALVVLFFLSPFIVHALGMVEYGLWSLLTVLTGYMGVLDLGIRASTGRFLMLYLGKEDARAVDETIRTALGFYSAFGLLVVAVGVALGWLFPALFRSVPAQYHLTAQVLLPLLAVNVWLSALQGVFSSVLIAHERFDLTRGVDLVVLALRTAATVLAIWWGYRIAALAVVVLGAHALALAGNYALARRVYPGLRLWPVLFDRTRLRELFGYGLAAFVTTVSIQIMGKTDLVVAGAAVGVAATAVYSVGAMLVFYSDAFLGHINWTLFPALQRAVARDEAGATRWLFLRAGRLRLAFGLLAYVGMIAFAEPFLRLWMLGPAFDEAAVAEAAMVMQILAAAMLLLLFKGASVSVLNAMGRIRLTAAMAATEAAANLALSLVFVLAFGWGLAGIAAGTLAARLLVGTFIPPWFACAAAGVPRRQYVAEIGGTAAVAGCLFASVCFAVRSLMPEGTWPLFFGQVALATSAYAAVAYGLLVPRADRRRLRNYVFGQLASNGTP